MALKEILNSLREIINSVKNNDTDAELLIYNLSSLEEDLKELIRDK
jgi:hypothetical protein